MKFSSFASPWPRRRAPRFNHRAHLEGVLGTALELQIVTNAPNIGPQIETEILAEIERLAAIFSVYDAASEFNRWQTTRGQNAEVSVELAQVLAQSEAWRARSDNAFNPAVEALTQKWKVGERRGLAPDAAELSALASEICAPLWRVETDDLRAQSPAAQRPAAQRPAAQRLTSQRASLNSIAKGFIIDRACEVARKHDAVDDILVNIGGDLRHAGRQTISVGIADPFTLADNAAPVAHIGLHNASLATSGRARRGFQIGARWFSHVLDPRTGWPVAQTVSASVVAPDALTADVVATICSVLAPAEARIFADALPDTGIFLLDENGQSTSNAFWRNLSRSVT